MKRISRLSLLAILLVTGAGCGSATTSLISDGMNIINEVSDSLRKVVDEDSAAKFKDTRSDVLKNRWENYLKRVEKWTKDRESGDLQEASWFLVVDMSMEKKWGRKGAITHIFGQRSGELDKEFNVWLNKKGVPVDKNTPVDEARKKAEEKGILKEMYTSAEAWFKESEVCMKNLVFAQDRLKKTYQKSKTEKLKDVATAWESFLQSQ